MVSCGFSELCIQSMAKPTEMQSYASGIFLNIFCVTILVNILNLLKLSMRRILGSSMHCTKAVAFAMRVPYMIKRKISKQPFVFLYKTYVRPYLEYCSWRTTNESILVSVIWDSEKNSWLIIIKTGLHGTL